MAVEERHLSKAEVARLDADGLVEAAGGKRQRVKETVVGLDRPLADEVVPQVAER